MVAAAKESTRKPGNCRRGKDTCYTYEVCKGRTEEEREGEVGREEPEEHVEGAVDGLLRVV